MSTITKLDPVLRAQPVKMRTMARTMMSRYMAETDQQKQLVYYAVYLAITALLTDSSRHGYTKGRIYKKILDEYMLNMTKLAAPKAPVVLNTPAAA